MISDSVGVGIVNNSVIVRISDTNGPLQAMTSVLLDKEGAYALARLLMQSADQLTATDSQDSSGIE